MSKEKILIVDDEIEMCHLIKSFLDNEQFQSYMVHDATSAMEFLDKMVPDLIILDVMLPDMSGMDLCLQIRNKVLCPIVFMSCKSEDIDKIIALSVGGDDYITKPFSSGELVARVKAHIRRDRRMKSQDDNTVCTYECNGLILDEAGRTVTLDNENIKLTAKEFDILNILMKNSKRVFSMNQLFEMVWKEESLAGDSKTIMVYISNIRKKIENKDDKYIYNIRGAGYKFNDNVTIHRTGR